MTDDKIIRVYLKDGFKFEGQQIELTNYFLTILDFQTNKIMTIPILNVARIEEQEIETKKVELTDEQKELRRNYREQQEKKRVRE